MLSYNEALEIIKKAINNISLNIVEVDLLNSTNRILAEDVISDIDLPPFNNSAMDGYAIKFTDRKSWKIIGEITAGNFHSLNLKEEEAILITTGSKIPDNANTVIPLENVIVECENLKLMDGVHIKKGMNIRLKANDLSKGSVALKKFTKVDSKAIAALASCGRGSVKVFSKLNAAILATGDELIPVNEIPNEDKIRASNLFAISSAMLEINHTPIILGFVKDDKEILRQQIKSAFEMDINMLITTGGVSVGKYDFLREVFEEEKAKELFWKVNIKPGKPTFFGIYEKGEKKIPIFGLPGNPVSSLVGFHIFIKPAINYLFKQKFLTTNSAILADDIIKTDGKRHFSRGIRYEENGEWKVTAKFSQSSGNLVEMSRANCLIIIAEEKKNLTKGERVECILI